MAAEEEGAPPHSPSASPGPTGDGDRAASGDTAGPPHAAADSPPLPPSSAHAPKPRPPPALPWMRVPIPIGGGAVPLGDVRGLDARIEAWLREGKNRRERGPAFAHFFSRLAHFFPPSPAGVTTLFPVQAATWAATAGGRGGAHDLAVCAPTGSGKTLACIFMSANSFCLWW